MEQSLAWLNESVAGLRRHNDKLAAAGPAEPPADALSRAVLGPDPDPVSRQGLTEVHRRETYNAAEVDAFLLEVDAEEEARLRNELAAERQRNTAC